MAATVDSALKTRPLSPVMGAIVDDIDLSVALDAATASAIRATLADHSLLLFRDQHKLTAASHVRFSALFGELMTFACQDRFAYYHRWSVGDVLVWDNRSSMHRVCEYDDSATRRLMHRTTIKGDRPLAWHAPG